MGTPMKSTVLDALKAASETIKAATKSAADAIKPTLQQFLAEHPRIRALRWEQFAPHFNDGEPCEFSVNSLHAFLFEEGKNEDDLPEGLYGNGWIDTEWGSKAEEAQLGEDLAALEELNDLLQASEAALKELLGADCTVTVTREGVEVSDCEHD